MAFENFRFDPIEEEQDLSLWADELGMTYEIGTQGSVGQPTVEMSRDRIIADAALKALRTRELGGLPLIMDDEEQELHITVKELARMSEDDKENWYERAREWLSQHPQTTIYNLIDRPPKLP